LQKLPFKKEAAMIRTLVLAATLWASSLAMAASSTLTLTINGVRDDQGMIRAGIYNTPDTFPKEGKAMARTSTAAKTGSVLLKFTDLPAGKYAVIVYHDENNDGQMDKRFGMIPIEGYGLSNNIKATGKPAFDQCAFEIPETQNQVIDLRY
jgi:uncharacterized protein (DUF2141 family)